MEIMEKSNVNQPFLGFVSLDIQSGHEVIQATQLVPKDRFLGHDSPTLPIEKGTHVFSPSKQDGTDRTAQNLQNLE